MPKAATPKAAERSEKVVLDQAIQQLLRATKDKAKSSGKSLNEEQLRKDRYTARFIDEVEKA